MNDIEDTDTTDFKKGLKTLLKTSYHPVNPSEKFRAELFERLKNTQKQTINKRKNKRNIRYAIFSFVSSAAAMALIAFGGLMDSTNISSNQITPKEQRTAVSQFGTNTNISNTSIDLTKATSKGGLEIARGVSLTMDSGSKVKLTNGILDISSGNISLKLSDNASPYEIKIKSHKIKLQPGSQLAMNVNLLNSNDNRNELVPDITLFRGKGLISNKQGSTTLLPNHTYRLHLYQEPEDANINDIDSLNPQGMPEMVNFKIIK